MNFNGAPVSEFNQQHPGAFESLFNSYYTSLCRFAEKILLDSNDAEDVVADVFSKLWARQVMVNADLNIQSFLYSSVKNAAIDLLRKRKSEAMRNKGLEYLLQQEEHFLSQIWRTEVVKEIIEEIESLIEPYKTVFKKLYVEGLSNKEVAKEMGVPESTISTQKSRALKVLKRKLFPDSVFTVTAAALTAAALLTAIALLLYYIHTP